MNLEERAASQGVAWVSGLSLDTDGHTPREAADRLARATGWLNDRPAGEDAPE